MAVAAVALSPNGRRLAYAVSRTDATELYMRTLDEPESKLVARAERSRDVAWMPLFSPDSQWLGFLEDGLLKKVAVSGGAPVTIATVGEARGASLGPGGTIVFAPESTSGLSHVSAEGGAPEILTLPNRDQREKPRGRQRVRPRLCHPVTKSRAAGRPFDVRALQRASVAKDAVHCRRPWSTCHVDEHRERRVQSLDADIVSWYESDASGQNEVYVGSFPDCEMSRLEAGASRSGVQTGVSSCTETKTRCWLSTWRLREPSRSAIRRCSTKSARLRGSSASCPTARASS